MRKRLLMGLVSALLVTPFTHAEDWAEFRGPGGTGVYNGKLPTKWSPTENVAWKTAIPGKGWSSPVLFQNKLYLTTGIAQEGSTNLYDLHVLCLDAGSGKVLWNELVFKDDGSLKNEVHKKNSPASPTPIIEGDKLFVHFGPWGTAALDLQGKTIWKQTELKFKPQHGNGGSPIIEKGKLIFTCDGTDQQYLVALDVESGKVKWKSERSVKPKLGFSFATPAVFTIDGTRQLIAMGPDMTGSYDPETGKENWRVTYTGWSLIQRPLYAHGLVYIHTGYVRPELLAVKPDGQGDVTKTHVAWKATKAVPNTPSLLLDGEELYMVSDAGTLTCMDAKTGKVHYSERLPGQFSASPLLSEGKIYLTTETGTGLIVPVGKEFKLAYRTEMNEKTFASFVPGDGAMYVRTETQLFKFVSK
jgi:outer membrane protein assembly factor BamB